MHDDPVGSLLDDTLGSDRFVDRIASLDSLPLSDRIAWARTAKQRLENRKREIESRTGDRGAPYHHLMIATAAELISVRILWLDKLLELLVKEKGASSARCTD